MSNTNWEEHFHFLDERLREITSKRKCDEQDFRRIHDNVKRYILDYPELTALFEDGGAPQEIGEFWSEIKTSQFYFRQSIGSLLTKISKLTYNGKSKGKQK